MFIFLLASTFRHTINTRHKQIDGHRSDVVMLVLQFELAFIKLDAQLNPNALTSD
ncbi:hypothetical protein ACMFWY_07280 [Roseiconus sp. JC912]|uniref:hypothetical protein n=1 Tax=Roseiconus sp. JC912 TaxID=3396307 RepID=UPI003A4C8278